MPYDKLKFMDGCAMRGVMGIGKNIRKSLALENRVITMANPGEYQAKNQSPNGTRRGRVRTLLTILFVPHPPSDFALTHLASFLPLAAHSALDSGRRRGGARGEGCLLARR